MARYGGEEDLRAAREAVRGLAAEVKELGAKELLASDAEEVLTGRLQSGNRLRRATAGAAKEAADAVARETAVRNVNTRGLQAETSAIEANTAARRRAASVARAAPQTPVSRALRYAGDPLFAQAHGVLGSGGGINDVRRQLGVGYGRARGLADAVGAGFSPRGLSNDVLGPAQTRAQAARSSFTAADAELEDAKRRYAATLRQTNATQSERDAAFDARATAQARRRAAQANLDEATSLEASAPARVAQRAAIQRERDASITNAEAQRDSAFAEREFARYRQLAAQQGAELIRHPTEFGKLGGEAGAALPGRGPAATFRSAAQIAALRGLNDPSGAGSTTPTRPPRVQGADFGDERLRLSDLQGLNRAEQSNALSLMQRRDAMLATADAAGNLGERERHLADYYRAQLSNLERTANATRSAASSQSQLAGASGRITNATRQAAVAYGTESQALRRRGALTSEFIAAAARGETTMREIGYQTVVTAAKFGGWTLAATALYGAAGAMREIGKGALDGSSGVHQLTRVINNVNGQQLQKQFQGLSEQFNLPIGTVSDAVYRMGQVFHDQGQAVDAAKAALFSYKTGEVDVATSTQNLIAITRGFGLSSNQLLSVYDQINQAQNTFGIRIGDTEAGLAKAAGTYRNAGGDLNYLLALFVAISKATNRSGQEIGTGIARGVNQIRRPGNQAALRGLGVDVNQDDFQSTLQSALKRARQGADPNALASGLLGNQYARLIAPVLRDQTTLNDALKNTSPAASQGSAQKELAKVLKQVDEQIQAIGNNLQRLGVALGQAGVFNAFGGLLKLVNFLLDKTTDLVNLFNSIVPPDVRAIVTPLLQAAAAMAAIRRVGGVNGKLAETLPILANPDRRLQVLATRGLRDQSTELTNSIESLSRGLVGATAQVEARRNVARNFESAYQGHLAAGTLPAQGTQERANLETQRLNLSRSALRAEEEAARQSDQINGLRQAQIRAQSELTTVQQLQATEVRGYLAANAIPVPAELQTPSSRGTRQVASEGGLVAASAVAGAGLSREAMLGLAEGGREAAAQIESLHNYFDFTDLRDKTIEPLKNASEALKHAGDAARNVPGVPGALPGPGQRQLTDFEHSTDAQGRLFGSLPSEGSFSTPFQRQPRQPGRLLTALSALNSAAGEGELGRSVQFLQKAGTKTIGALARGGSGFISRAALTLKGLGNSMATFARSLGPIDVALFAFIAGSLINEKIGELTKDVDEAEKYISAYRGNTQKAQRELEEKAKEVGSTSRGDRRRDLLTRTNDLLNPVKLFGSTLPSIIQGNYETPQARRARVQQEFADQQQEANTRKQLQGAAAQRGGPIPQLTYDQLTKQVDADSRARRAGLISQREFDRRMANHAIEAKTLLEPTAATLAIVAQTIAGARFASGSPQTFRQSLKGLDIKALTDTGTMISGALETFGATRDRLGKLSAVYSEAVSRLGDKTDASSVNQLAQFRDAYYSEIEKVAQADLDTALGSATSEQQRRAAYTNAGNLYRRQTIGRAGRQRDAVGSRLALARSQRDDARDAYNQGPTIGLNPVSPLGIQDFGGGLRADKSAIELRKAFEKRQAEVRRLAAAKKVADREFEAAKRKYRELAQQLKDASYEDRATGRQIDLTLAQSTTRDQSVQASQAIRSAGRQLHDALVTYGRKDRRYKQALAAYNQAVQQGTDALLADIDADNALSLANAGNDPTAQLKVGVSNAQRTLTALKSHNADSTQIKQAQATVISARNAYAQQLEQDAADLVAAQFELKEARTTDPVKKAKLAAQAAHAAIKFAKTPAEKVRAQADAARADRDVIDQRLQSREDTIDFNLNMERISTDVAISQYRALLKTAHLSKEQRRTILQRIHDLKKTAEDDADGFDLDVGSIKMPTVYDVRRALDNVKGTVRGAAKSIIDKGASPASRGLRIDPQVGSGGVHNSISVVVHVSDRKSADHVYHAIDKALKTNVKAKARNARRR
jgi:TP901 family phage tail tape measure protein